MTTTPAIWNAGEESECHPVISQGTRPAALPGASTKKTALPAAAWVRRIGSALRIVCRLPAYNRQVACVLSRGFWHGRRAGDAAGGPAPADRAVDRRRAGGAVAGRR